MKIKNKLISFILLAIDFALIGFLIFIIVKPFLHFSTAGFLNPQGTIATQEKNLIITATLLMLIAVIPVYFLIFFFAHKYRAGNKQANYSPNLDSNLGALLVWAIPGSIIFILGIINWQTTHALDPYKPLTSNLQPLTIQVIALQWKFLFIYPEQNIATVNFIEFPVGTPLNFELTADAPMSSFWIPQLGSQVYAMPAMSTQLHLMANQPGDFKGMDTEINGTGFSGMKFIARATSQSNFNQWLASVKQSSDILNSSAYDDLAKPSENNSTVLYSSVDKNLYNSVMMKYMMPQSEMPTTANSSSTMNMSGMDMQK